MKIEPYPKSLTENTDFEKYLKKELNKLEKEILEEVEKEIKNKDLIQFKGFIDIKSIFTLKLDKFKNFFNKTVLQGKLNKFLKKHLTKGIERTEEALNINLLGVKIKPTKLMESTRVKILKASMFSKVKDLNNITIDKLKSEIFNGVINGESIPKIKKRINVVFDKEYRYAETMARTESASLLGQGEAIGAKESGLKLRKYLSVHFDNRTSSICKELGSKYGEPEQSIPMDRKFKWNYGKGGEKVRNPFHPNCRTAVVYYQQADYDSLKKRKV